MRKNCKYGFINKKGELVLDCIYDLEDTNYSESDTYFNDAGIVVLELNGRKVFVDKSGNIIKTAFHIDRLDENWLVNDGGGYELIDDAVTTVLKYKESLDYLDPYEGNIVRARIGKKWGLINLQGESILPFIFERIRHIYI